MTNINGSPPKKMHFFRPYVNVNVSELIKNILHNKGMPSRFDYQHVGLLSRACTVQQNCNFSMRFKPL